MVTENQRNEALDDQWLDKMRSPFNPQHRPESVKNPDERLADAAEYAAFQLGEIRKLLQALVRNTGGH